MSHKVREGVIGCMELRSVVIVVTHNSRNTLQQRFGTVPGDGVHVVWPMLLGPNRGRYFLLTGQRISAEEAHRLGVINEVLGRDEVLARARAIAADLARQPDTVLRYTRDVLTQSLRRALFEGLSHGLAAEGLGAFESWPVEGPGEATQ